MTDLKMQGQSGLDLLETVLADDPQQRVSRSSHSESIRSG